MNHPEEHIIELYVLGAQEIDAQREEITAHLSVCLGCREVATEIESFYRELQLEQVTSPDDAPAKSLSLVKANSDSAVIFERPQRSIPTRPTVRVGRIRWLMRTYPLATGTGGMALTAAAIIVLLSLFKQSASETNPSYVYPNEAQSKLEAFNSKDQKLWEMPILNLHEYVEEQRRTGDVDTKVLDVNGDGKNEILTRLPLARQPVNSRDVLHILNYDKSSLRDIRIGEPVQYGDRLYPSDFTLSSFACDDFLPGKRRSILIAANNSHSPSIIYHYDGDGNAIGTYRHFGHLLSIIEINIEGKKAVAVLGLSDKNENEEAQPVIVVLDPKMIKGDYESSFAGGFGYPISPAELYYVMIPRSDLARLLGTPVRLRQPATVDLPKGRGLSVVDYGNESNDVPVFQYIFDSDMTVKEVKSANYTKQAFDRFANEGRLHGDFYRDYLRALARDVRYWTGSHWATKAQPVQQ
jgi:hypothetical protein